MNPVDRNDFDTEPQILVNENQANLDPTVVVAEADRTVVLTENDTIVIDKPTPCCAWLPLMSTAAGSCTGWP